MKSSLVGIRSCKVCKLGTSFMKLVPNFGPPTFMHSVKIGDERGFGAPKYVPTQGNFRHRVPPPPSTCIYVPSSPPKWFTYFRYSCIVGTCNDAFTLDVKSVLNGKKSRWHPRWHQKFNWAIGSMLTEC
jgi:hypothetical protein